MLILSSLIDNFDESHHPAIVERATKFLNDTSLVISGGSEKIFVFIVAKIAKFYGIHGDYDNVISICEIGIQKNYKLRSYYLMEYFFYYQALAYHKKKSTNFMKQYSLNVSPYYIMRAILKKLRNSRI